MPSRRKMELPILPSVRPQHSPKIHLGNLNNVHGRACEKNVMLNYKWKFVNYNGLGGK
jgi:hypothetical protein